MVIGICSVIQYLCLKGSWPSEVQGDMVVPLGEGAPSEGGAPSEEGATENKCGRESMEDELHAGRRTMTSSYDLAP